MLRQTGRFVAVCPLLAFVAGSGVALAAEGIGCGGQVALWLLNGDGSDETTVHDLAFPGGCATFLPVCGSQGLYTAAAGCLAEYPALPEMSAGLIAFEFELESIFAHDAGYNNPISIITSNRIGHLVGDMAVRLDPTDGKLWFTQEDTIVSEDWTIRSAKDTWDPGVCYRVELRWNEAGRSMRITAPDWFELQTDSTVRPVFSPQATITEILSRAADSPPIGVTLNWLEIGNPCPPVSLRGATWGRIKSLYQ